MIGMILGVLYLYALAALCYWLGNKLSPSKDMWSADSIWSIIFAILFVFFLVLAGIFTIPVVVGTFIAIVSISI